jgi:hypothetical protein
MKSYNYLKRDPEVKSKYKYVYPLTDTSDGSTKFKARFQLPGLQPSTKLFETEHEAAKAVDIFRISRGKAPINVLKPASK